MNKKILVIGLIAMMLVASSPVYAMKLDKEEQNLRSDTESNEEVNLVLDSSQGETILQLDNDSENQTGYKAGWLKVETKGKGIAVFYEIPVLKLSHSLSTLQYKDFNPFMVSYYLCYIIYNDENATTKITNTVSGNKTYINGTHSLISGFFGSQSLYFFGNLVTNGLFDGFGIDWMDNMNLRPHPIANIVKNILNKIPGFPIVNMTNLGDFLSPFFFGPYNWGMQPTFQTPFISEIRENILDSILKIPVPVVANMLYGLAQLGFGIGSNVLCFIPWMFMPRWLPRVQMLNLIEPINKTGIQSGYSVFTYWNENPKQERIDKVNGIQDFLYDTMLKIDEFAEKGYNKIIG